MKVVILAGGLGTRLMEETESRPKPMVEIAGKPILWHIMKIYEAQGFNDFVICLGYKATMIKEYFLNYYLYNSDVTIELAKNKVDVHFSNTESFKVTLIDTGIETNTAGRIKRIKKYTEGKPFMLTYGDGVSNVDLKALLNFHRSSGKLATLTSIQLPGRFGHLNINDAGLVEEFQEKPEDDGLWINGGFFVMEQGIFDYLEGDMDQVQWEKKPLYEIARDGQLAAYQHKGFWKAMDAMRDRIELEELWKNGKAEWKIW
ncbi:MAG: glucose-1-phosphate cytidylyltransferase [Saprospiraceae bacterium]|nr:glucose-1-phosphate cytidylyltransferase [Candidatus Vicinibacter affinis]MBP6172600.1 glucose-1-phosphate cytidylyltransferase [Saprospiraceae bacterium]MBK6572386.1 glucose-1-phosphate cytidylyltransferase [Candidatus Vicinibacter affinis]MBK6825191.1 glucose-1-phosphate cytidylyltransferase [Candidatus Vicinibacter affinis]MBK7303985.1 glucose-1-phosphate cytidylyltransferase [Candidatus Vicinibacter affinis]